MENEKDSQTPHQECALSDTDVFTPAFVQTDIRQGVYEDVYPISKLNDNGPVEFVVENASEMFLDLANTYFKFSLKIVKADGTNLDADEKSCSRILHLWSFSESGGRVTWWCQCFNIEQQLCLSRL